MLTRYALRQLLGSLRQPFARSMSVENRRQLPRHENGMFL